MEMSLLHENKTNRFSFTQSLMYRKEGQSTRTNTSMSTSVRHLQFEKLPSDAADTSKFKSFENLFIDNRGKYDSMTGIEIELTHTPENHF